MPREGEGRAEAFHRQVKQCHTERAAVWHPGPSRWRDAALPATPPARGRVVQRALDGGHAFCSTKG